MRLLVLGLLASGSHAGCSGRSAGTATAVAAGTAAGTGTAASAAAGVETGTGMVAPGPVLDVGPPDPLLPPGVSAVQPVAGQPGLFLVRRRTEIWASPWEVTVATRSPAVVDAAVTACFAELNRLEPLLSEWVEGGDVSRINAAAGHEPVPAATELTTTISIAREASLLTGGGFDLTSLPLGRLWKLDDPAPAVPGEAALAAARARVDFRKLHVDDGAGTVFLEQTGMAIGLGGIGQGVGVDRCGALLRASGLRDFVIDGSGDLLVSGSKGTEPWRVGVAHPRRPERSFVVLAVPAGAMVTSGDYEHFAVIDGRRYHHIIDPATGYPVTHTASVTVFAATATLADALATGLFVLGATKGMPVVESRPDLEAIFVAASGVLHVSSGLAEVVFDEPTLNMGSPED